MDWKKASIFLTIIVLLLLQCSPVPFRFEGETDIGGVAIPGSMKWSSTRGSFVISGSGENMWGDRDAFFFAWRKAEGDLKLEAMVNWQGKGKHEHRKAGWMVRQDLSTSAPYADVVVHGDSLISLQYRLEKNGPTLEIQSPWKAPAVVRLERNEDVFTLSVKPSGDEFQPVGSISVPLQNPVYAGLAVCSHDSTVAETALLSCLTFENVPETESTERVLESTLETVSIETGQRSPVFRRVDHFEAPNWSKDGVYFIYNSHGNLYKLDRNGGEPVRIETGTANRCNNDHGLSPDGLWLALSHSPEDRSLIYVVAATGGEPRLVTEKGPSYWHGWSPDGGTLAYCAQRGDNYDIYIIPTSGGRERRLTRAEGLDDGPDYTADGEYIYFNSVRTGSMKIWRMKSDGSEQEQVTFDDNYADWFPHPSPDGRWLVFLSYAGTVSGHPPEKDVSLRIMPLAGGEPAVLVRLFGGQGTINVPSWSPDSKEIAFVSYRRVVSGK
jgi:TolB protein